MSGMKLERSEDGFCIDAEQLGRLLALPAGQVQALMRARAITCVFERGEGDHDGRNRLTFFHGRRRVRLDLDDAGQVLRRSTVDMAPPPAAGGVPA